MSYELATKTTVKQWTHCSTVVGYSLRRLICYITYQISPVTLNFEDGHTEQLCFFLYHSVHHLLILEYPWLKFHNPQTDWSMGKRCFSAQQAASFQVSNLDMVSESDHPDLTGVPQGYWHLKEVFGKSRVKSPPLWDYDCAIYLLPGAPIPKGRLCPLSAPEQQTMEDYINSSLQAGTIWPSSSSAGVGFFFFFWARRTRHNTPA